MKPVSFTFRSLASGAAAMSAVGVLRLAVQFLSVPLMARMLSLDDYGLSAIAMPFVLFILVIADAGLGSSLIRLPSIRSSEWHSCFWMMALVGAVLSTLLALASPLLGTFYNDPRLTPIVATLSLLILAQTLATVPGAALQHSKRFGLIASIEAVATLASLGTALFAASSGHGAWALVWQQVVFYGLRLVLTCLASPYRPALIFNLAEARGHFAFGGHLLGSNLVLFCSRSLDSLMLGKVAGTGPVGIYAMALQFARLPFMLVTGPIQFAVYPHVADLRDNRQAFTSLYLLLTRFLATVVFPPVALAAAASQPIFHLLLSPKWGDAATIFALLAPSAALQPVTALSGTFVTALGRPDFQMRLSLQFSALWVIVVLITAWQGINAVAASYSIFVLCFASLWSVPRYMAVFGCTIRQYGAVFLMPISVTITSVLIYIVLSYSINADGPRAILAGCLAVTAVVASLFIQRSEMRAALLVLRDAKSMPAADRPDSH